MRQHGKWGVVLLAMAIMASGCGARLNAQQVAAAARARSGGASRSASGPGLDGAGSDQSTGGDLTGGGGGGGGSGGGGGGGGGGSSAGGRTNVGSSGQSGSVTTLPAAGNGGATDIGVTGTTITIGGVSTLSGPVPGLFAGAVYGTRAWVAYQNSLGGINGRKFSLTVRDDQFDAGQNGAQTKDLINKVFALVGSFSIYDESGAVPVRESGIPDVNYSLSIDRQKAPNNFSPASSRSGWRTGPLLYYKEKFGDAYLHVGTIVGDVPAARSSWAGERNAMEHVGYKIVYERFYAATETDFTADVVRMSQGDSGGPVQMVSITSADVKTLARFATAALKQNFRPKLFTTGGIAYDPSLVPLAGKDAVEGVISDMQNALFLGEDRAQNPEVDLFLTWLQKTKPGYKPDLFALFAWASGRLFGEAVKKAGPKLTRPAVVGALKTIDNWDTFGMFAPSGPASKRPATCYLMVKIHDGQFSRYDSPANGYRCGEGEYYPPIT